jgi:Zn finger protein HypA/HybF involved in hydrogenase expression
MNKGEVYQIIEKQVNAKVSELSTWKPVRWEGGRLYYEATTIDNEIADYDVAIQLLYLECLETKKYTIQDNLPSSAPDITAEFKNWIAKSIAKLKIKQLQEEERLVEKSVLDKKKKRPVIPYKTKALLLKEVNLKCAFCTNNDVHHFQVHHIDENPSNNSFNNLIMVCPNCHSKITKGDIRRVTVTKIKQDLSNT